MARTLADHAEAMSLGMRLYLFPSHDWFRRRTVQLACLEGAERVLDFGCGVGLLDGHLLAGLGPEGVIVGVDIDERLLDVAKRTHVDDHRAEYALIEPGGALPFEPATFDRVCSNLVLHLLSREQRLAMLAEFLRILRPGGRLVLAEFGVPGSLWGRADRAFSGGLWERLFPYESNAVDCYEGLLPGQIEAAGFEDVVVAERFRESIDWITALRE